MTTADVPSDSHVPAYDAAIVGGGVVGCAVLRALTLAGLRCLLLERGADILAGASKGNSAILHTGFDASPLSLESRLVQRGHAEYRKIHERLGLPLLETDAILVAWNEEQAAELPAIRRRAADNGVSCVRNISRQEILCRLPHLSAASVSALHITGEAIIDPWSAPLAYAVQALANGARIERAAGVTGAKRDGRAWRLMTPRGEFLAGIVINCAGNFGDVVESFARPAPFRMAPRKGQFVVFDKIARRFVPSIILPVPSAHTKGIVLCPTIFGNVMVGPTSEEQFEREHARTDEVTLNYLLREAARIVPSLGDEPVTSSFAGIRPATERSDYIIESLQTERWITVAGIRSTGLTAALGIAEHVTGLVEASFQKLAPLEAPAWPRVLILRSIYRAIIRDQVGVTSYVFANSLRAMKLRAL